MDRLKGWKTNIGMVILGLIGIAASMSWITVEQAALATAVIGPATGIAMRQGVKASAPKVEQ